jgi:3-oxoadipate enol-lactonase
MEFVTHDGRETAYRFVKPDAAGPTVLYIHGSGGSHQIWGHQYHPDGPTHPAVALDLSGHGESDDIDTEPGPPTLAAYADDAAAVAKETDAEILVGNSLGGAVVFEVVLENQYEPDGLVFAGTGAKLAVHETIRTMLEEDFEQFVRAAHESSRFFHDGDDELRETSEAALRAAGQAITRRDFLTCHTFDVRDRLGEIDEPSLAIVGKDDQLTPPNYHEYLEANIPTCTMQQIENAAHLAMIERPVAFNTILANFCTQFVTDR